jgi:CubicO group peptidase (beta-lactamase class C family)
MKNREKSLQAILDKTLDEKKIFGTSFAIKYKGETWLGSSGNLTINQPYFIASTTKLFTTAIILHLKAEGKLSLDDKISQYLSASMLKGLHIYKGIEYSSEITLKHCMAHTSGLADYFQDKGMNGKSLEDELVAGHDQAWNFEQAINRTKAIKPHFAPETKNKAHYSDGNFQILGKIIESITGISFSENCINLIFKPLGLSQTYLYLNPNDKTAKTLYYKSNPLNIPLAMSSMGADGGIVSTSMDMLLFIESFFSGKLFPKMYLEQLQQWNRIFFPMQSGIGLHLFKLPWFFNPFGTIPYFIGHSGLSGALAYYSPRENLFVAGTVNQVAHPDISFKTMIKLTQKLKK